MAIEYNYFVPERALTLEGYKPTGHPLLLSFTKVKIDQREVRSHRDIPQLPGYLQLAAYAVPWIIMNSSKLYLIYKNPNLDLLDLIGGRLNSQFEHPNEFKECAYRELSEEVGLDRRTTFDEEEIGWFINREGRTLYPVFSPFTVLGNQDPESLKLMDREELHRLTLKATSHRLLAAIELLK